MKKRKSKIYIRAKHTDFDTAREFLEKELRNHNISGEIIGEDILVFEELFLRIVNQVADEDTEICVMVRRRLGEVTILIDYFGDRFNVDFDKADKSNPGEIILNKHKEKISHSFRKGYNTIGIMARRFYDRTSYWIAMSILAAVAVYSIAHLFLSPSQEEFIFQKVVFPIEGMFGNAMLMIASPITFFSIVTNITNIYVLADNRINLRSLFRRIAISSFTAMLIASLFLIVLNPLLHRYVSNDMPDVPNIVAKTFLNDVYSIVPNNIFEPFSTISPFPIILIAIIGAAAICSMNTHFETMKEINDALDTLCVRALSIIMLALPFATFLSFMDVLLAGGYKALFSVLVFVLFVILGCALMVLFISCKASLAGVRPDVFIKKCIPAMKENYKINSSIDAVPYNTRFMNRTFGSNIDRLDLELPILAQVNQRGNCFVLMFVGLLLATRMDVDIVSMVLLAVLIFFLALGTPGQNGSLIIGLLLVISFLGIGNSYICAVIYCEALFGRSLPLLNTFDDMATVLLVEAREKRKNRSI